MNNKSHNCWCRASIEEENHPCRAFIRPPTMEMLLSTMLQVLSLSVEECRATFGGVARILAKGKRSRHQSSSFSKVWLVTYF